jgi:hypothetical protein
MSAMVETAWMDLQRLQNMYHQEVFSVGLFPKSTHLKDHSKRENVSLYDILES